MTKKLRQDGSLAMDDDTPQFIADQATDGLNARAFREAKFLEIDQSNSPNLLQEAPNTFGAQ